MNMAIFNKPSYTLSSFDGFLVSFERTDDGSRCAAPFRALVQEDLATGVEHKAVNSPVR